MSGSSPEKKKMLVLCWKELLIYLNFNPNLLVDNVNIDF